jgi:hypothetical protein
MDLNNCWFPFYISKLANLPISSDKFFIPFCVQKMGFRLNLLELIPFHEKEADLDFFTFYALQ